MVRSNISVIRDVIRNLYASKVAFYASEMHGFLRSLVTGTPSAFPGIIAQFCDPGCIQTSCRGLAALPPRSHVGRKGAVLTDKQKTPGRVTARARKVRVTWLVGN